MPAVVETPVELVESMADLKFPPGVNSRMQALMDLNSQGQLSADERVELESLVEWGEELSIIRARALHTLGRKLA